MSSFPEIRWQCRRGMRELDELLTRFLDTKYADSPSDVQMAFVELLKLSDPELVKLCLLYTSPSPRDYAASRMPSSA